MFSRWKMKLQRKRLAILTAIVCFMLLISAAYLASNNGVVKSDPETPDIPADPNGPLLVVPEYSIGTIGALGALIAAVVIFAVISKRK